MVVDQILVVRVFIDRKNNITKDRNSHQWLFSQWMAISIFYGDTTNEILASETTQGCKFNKFSELEKSNSNVD